MSKPNDSDPCKVLFWYRDQYVLYWEKLGKVDNKWHEWLYARFPKSIQFGGTILRWLYRGAISPAFAVILTLLLVGLVITGVVPLILSISVFTAWLVAVLSLAKSNWVNRLRIVRRVMIVLAGATLMAIAANSYVGWCLRSYYRNHPTSIASNTNTVGSDALLIQRFKELLEEEQAKAQARAHPPVNSTASKGVAPKQQPPTVIQTGPTFGSLKRALALSDEIMTDLYKNGWRYGHAIPSRLQILPQSIRPRPTTSEGWRNWNDTCSVAFHSMYYQRVVDIRNEFAELHLRDIELDDFIKGQDMMKQNPSTSILWWTSTPPVEIESVAERLTILAEELDDQKK